MFRSCGLVKLAGRRRENFRQIVGVFTANCGFRGPPQALPLKKSAMVWAIACEIPATAVMSLTPLDDIPGIGAARKKALLAHFGSAKAVARAGVSDMTAVAGISQAMAQTIADYFSGRG